MPKVNLLAHQLGAQHDQDLKTKFYEVMEKLDLAKEDIEELACRERQGRPSEGRPSAKRKKKVISKLTRFQRILAIEPKEVFLENYDCDQCPFKECAKRFKYRSSLVNHMKIHQGLKDFKCRFCEKTFTTKGNKKDHERRHLRMYLFVCNKCGKRFPRGDDYNQNQAHAYACSGNLVKVTEVPNLDIKNFK